MQWMAQQVAGMAGIAVALWQVQNVTLGTGMGEVSLLFCQDGHGHIQTTSLLVCQEFPFLHHSQNRLRRKKRER